MLPHEINEEVATILSLPKDHFLFASEGVGEGHSDKMCDQLADSVVDSYLSQDPYSDITCEVTMKGNTIMVLGRITSSAKINIEQIVRLTMKDIGYTKEKGFDWDHCFIMDCIEIEHVPKERREQNKNIYDSLLPNRSATVIGYATDEWDKTLLSPLSHHLATRLCMKLNDLRKNKELIWLRPDCKAQVSVEYVKNNNGIKPIRVFNVLISTQHDKTISQDEIKKTMIEKVIKKVISPELLDEKTMYYVNPSNSFVIGGPAADAGLTGRKIIVDSYGGWAGHGGGSFSGKDPTKVERTGAYYCRYVAKSLVASGLCHRVIVRATYTENRICPLSVFVDSLGTVREGLTDRYLLEIVLFNFDFRLSSMIKELNLLRPIYKKTASSCHFGRNDPDFTWEKPKKLEGY